MSQQPPIDTIRLLLLHDSQDEAELLLNTLRKAGKATRAELVRDEDTLVTLLKGGEWDAIIACPGAAGCTLARVAAHARKLGHDIPVIVLTETRAPEKVVDFMKTGARDVVVRQETAHLILVLEREMSVLAMLREKQRLEADLRESERRSELLMDAAQDAVAYVTDGMHVEANAAYLDLFGYQNADDLAGVPIMDLVAESHHKELKELLRKQTTAAQGEKHEISCPCMHTDGHEFNATMVFSPATFDGEPCTQVLIRAAATVASGVSDAEMEARLKEVSSIDSLTGLKNRSWFMGQMEEAVAAAKVRRKHAGLLLIQIDNFTTLRTSVGLGGADTALQELAARLSDIFQKANGQVARFGDDLFAALVDITKAEAIKDFAEKVRADIDTNLFEVQKKTLHITVSIGGALVDENIGSGQDALSLAADAAAKVRQRSSAGNGVFVFDPTSLIDSSSESGMGKHLQIALEKNHFKLYYQPILNLEDNAEETYEVLLRFPLNDKELAPAEFMQASAAGGLNTKIDRWVILNALKVLAEHNAKGRKTRIMVTLTTDSVADASLPQWLGVALRAARISGESLVLQITESDAASHLKQLMKFQDDIAALGIGLAINRFGAGASTIKVLEHLGHVRYVKLDGSFMQELGTETGRQAIAGAIKTIQQNGKLVIASHVETASALQALWAYGINYIEGFYVSPALAAMEYPFSE